MIGCPKKFDVHNKWAVPENLHTIPRTAFQNSEGKGRFFELEIGRHGRYLRWEFRRHGGFLDLGFPQETDKSVFLEKANFVDF